MVVVGPRCVRKIIGGEIWVLQDRVRNSKFRIFLVKLTLVTPHVLSNHQNRSLTRFQCFAAPPCSFLLTHDL